MLMENFIEFKVKLQIQKTIMHLFILAVEAVIEVKGKFNIILIVKKKLITSQQYLIINVI